MEDMDEEEEDLLEDRTAKIEEQQELLDEIQRNKQRANGFLDDDLLNRSVRYAIKFLFSSSPLQKEKKMATDTLSVTITLCPIIIDLLFVRNIVRIWNSISKYLQTFEVISRRVCV